MNSGVLYGIGVGPGDPDLITVKAAKILGRCEHVFAPRPRGSSESASARIAERHLNPAARLHEVVFPMSSDREELEAEWLAATAPIAEVLAAGSDACYLTLGDTMLYSTYLYMLRALRRRMPDVQVITIPGITSFSAAAALAEIPLGEGEQSLTVVPASAGQKVLSQALSAGGTVAVMKIGKRLPEVLEVMEREGALDRAVFVSRAGMDNQRTERDLRRLHRDISDRMGNLSIILVRAQTAAGHAARDGE